MFRSFDHMSAGWDPEAWQATTAFGLVWAALQMIRPMGPLAPRQA